MGPLILHEDFPDGSLDLELGPGPNDFFHEDLPKRQKSSPKKRNNSASLNICKKCRHQEKINTYLF